jgi:hypothetical protein
MSGRTVGQALVRTLEANGVDNVFGPLAMAGRRQQEIPRLCLLPPLLLRLPTTQARDAISSLIRKDHRARSRLTMFKKQVSGACCIGR